MSICPKCKQEIEYLDIMRAETIEGIFIVESNKTNHLWRDTYPNNNVDYYCPKCDARLFMCEKEAKKFLIN